MDKNTAIKVFIVAICVILLINLGLSAYNYYSLKKPLDKVYENNKHLRGVGVEVYFQSPLNNKVLYFNLKTVSRDSEKLAPFEFLVRMAQELTGRDIDTVYLQYRGKTKFIIPGPYFMETGALSMDRDIMEIALVFPPNITDDKGKSPFIQPHGEERYVLANQRANFLKFLQVWYLEDMKNELLEQDPKKGDKGKTSSPEIDEVPVPTETSLSPDEIPRTPLVDKTPEGTPLVEPFEIRETPIEIEPPQRTPSTPSSPWDHHIPPIEPEEL